jgi:hypothetical protein
MSEWHANKNRPDRNNKVFQNRPRFLAIWRFTQTDRIDQEERGENSYLASSTSTAVYISRFSSSCFSLMNSCSEWPL